MTPTLSRAIREAAIELKLMPDAHLHAVENVITQHLSPILSPPAGEEAKRAAMLICTYVPFVENAEDAPPDTALIGRDQWMANFAFIIQLAISQAQAPLVERVGKLEKVLLEAELSLAYDDADQRMELSLRLQTERQALTPKELA